MRYPLLTIKRVTFLLFKDIIDIMHNKKHLDLKGAESDLKGAESLINIIVSMNKGRTDKILSNFPGILPIVLLKISSLTINNVSVD